MMKRSRKTKAERDREWKEAELRQWELFQSKLDAVQSFEDAVKLLAQAPPPDTPGRRYYSNLGFFLQTFAPPAGSNYTEKVFYIRLIQQIDEAGLLKPGARPQIEEALRNAISAQKNW